MRRISSLLFLEILGLVLWVGGASARTIWPDQDWATKVRSEKIAFLTAEMDLSPQDAEVFWPVYNVVEKERRSLMEDLFRSYKTLKTALDAGKTGKEVEDLLQAYLKADQESHSAEQRFSQQFLNVLPVEKVAKLYIAEEKFRREQIHRLNRKPISSARTARKDQK